MIKSVNRFLSYSGKNTKRSAIREILKFLQKPGMISFAGGLPAPETFPVEDSPYREVRFEGEPQKLMFELDKTGKVISLCTFSKIFAPGSTFFCNDSGRNTIRINFSFSNHNDIEEGVKRLAMVIREEIKGK